jgi:hypothetical protein
MDHTDIRRAQERQRIYPVPRIDYILSRRSGYNFFTKPDISMQYTTFEIVPGEHQPRSHRKSRRGRQRES